MFGGRLATEMSKLSKLQGSSSAQAWIVKRIRVNKAKVTKLDTNSKRNFTSWFFTYGDKIVKLFLLSVLQGLQVKRIIWNSRFKFFRLKWRRLSILFRITLSVHGQLQIDVYSFNFFKYFFNKRTLITLHRRLENLVCLINNWSRQFG